MYIESTTMLAFFLSPIIDMVKLYFKNNGVTKVSKTMYFFFQNN